MLIDADFVMAPWPTCPLHKIFNMAIQILEYCKELSEGNIIPHQWFSFGNDWSLVGKNKGETNGKFAKKKMHCSEVILFFSIWCEPLLDVKTNFIQSGSLIYLSGCSNDYLDSHILTFIAWSRTQELFVLLWLNITESTFSQHSTDNKVLVTFTQMHKYNECHSFNQRGC